MINLTYGEDSVPQDKEEMIWESLPRGPRSSTVMITQCVDGDRVIINRTGVCTGQVSTDGEGDTHVMTGCDTVTIGRQKTQ